MNNFTLKMEIKMKKFFVSHDLEIFSEVDPAGRYNIPVEVTFGSIKNPLFTASSLMQASEFVKYAKKYPDKIKYKPKTKLNKTDLLEKQGSFETQLFEKGKLNE